MGSFLPLLKITAFHTYNLFQRSKLCLQCSQTGCNNYDQPSLSHSIIKVWGRLLNYAI